MSISVCTALGNESLRNLTLNCRYNILNGYSRLISTFNCNLNGASILMNTLNNSLIRPLSSLVYSSLSIEVYDIRRLPLFSNVDLHFKIRESSRKASCLFGAPEISSGVSTIIVQYYLELVVLHIVSPFLRMTVHYYHIGIWMYSLL